MVDTSVLVEVLLRPAAASAARTRLLAADQSVNAPHLLDLELLQVIRRCVAGREITPERAQSALDTLGSLPIRRHGHRMLLPRIWALRHDLTAYDAAYVALAEFLDAILLTGDRRIAAAAGHQARVELWQPAGSG